MVRPCASQQSKDFGLLFSATVTVETSKADVDYRRKTIGRSGLFSIFDGLHRCFPGAVRPTSRHGVSQVELNKHVERYGGFLRYRYRAHQTSCYRYAKRRWRNPDDPVDMAFLSSVWHHVNARGIHFGQECALEQVVAMLREFNAKDCFDYSSCTLYEAPPPYRKSQGSTIRVTKDGVVKQGGEGSNSDNDSAGSAHKKHDGESSEESEGEHEHKEKCEGTQGETRKIKPKREKTEVSEDANGDTESAFAGLNGLAGVALAAANGFDPSSATSQAMSGAVEASLVSPVLPTLGGTASSLPLPALPGLPAPPLQTLPHPNQLTLNLWRLMADSMTSSTPPALLPGMSGAMLPAHAALLPGATSASVLLASQSAGADPSALLAAHAQISALAANGAGAGMALAGSSLNPTEASALLAGLGGAAVEPASAATTQSGSPTVAKAPAEQAGRPTAAAGRGQDGAESSQASQADAAPAAGEKGDAGGEAGKEGSKKRRASESSEAEAARKKQTPEAPAGEGKEAVAETTGQTEVAAAEVKSSGDEATQAHVKQVEGLLQKMMQRVRELEPLEETVRAQQLLLAQQAEQLRELPALHQRLAEAREQLEAARAGTLAATASAVAVKTEGQPKAEGAQALDDSSDKKPAEAGPRDADPPASAAGSQGSPCIAMPSAKRVRVQQDAAGSLTYVYEDPAIVPSSRSAFAQPDGSKTTGAQGTAEAAAAGQK